jgi:predicted nucleic acid-binding protein
MESAIDRAMVPPIWKIEVANALGKAVARRKLTLERAKEIWGELARLPISETPSAHDVSTLLELAVRHNISVYDACYLQDARAQGLPLATNDQGLKVAAESNGVVVMAP